MRIHDNLIVRLRLNDTGRIGQSGLLLPDHRPAGSLRSFLQNMQQLCDRNVFLVCRSSETLQEHDHGPNEAAGKIGRASGRERV